MHSTTFLASALALAGAAIAAPASNKEPACVPGRIVAPPMITLSADKPSKEVCLPKANTLFLLSTSEEDANSTQHQIALFRGIPKGATSCGFGWKQRKENTEKSFKTFEGNGFIDFRLISEEARPFTFEKVDKLIKEEKAIGGIDMTNWDGPDFGMSRFHSGGQLGDCQEEMNVLLSIGQNPIGGALLQSVGEAENEEDLQGVFVRWTC